MNSWDQIKSSFNRGDNMVRKLILINVAVFVLLNSVNIFAYLITGVHGSGEQVNRYFFLPAGLSGFVYQPWTLITYMFAHEGFWHILSNMLWLWFLGSMFQEYLGNKKLLQIYFWGGISGGVFYLLGMNLIPVFRDSEYFNYSLQGASGGVLAVIVGIATLLPNYQVRIIIFDIKLKYIAIAWALISFFGISGSNAGGSLAHLGGVVFGYFYIKNIRNYTFLDSWGSAVERTFKKIFKRKRDEKTIRSSYSVYMKTTSDRRPDSDEVDAILDKINKSGYDSLTRSEREILFKASQQD